MLSVFEFTALLASGLLAGSLLTEACILVPYWKRLRPDEFLRLHPTLAPSLYRFYAPLTVAGTLMPILAWIGVSYVTGSLVHTWLVSAVAAGTILGLYLLFFRQANALFATTQDAEQASATLLSWAKLHNVRTGVALLGFGAAAIAYAS